MREGQDLRPARRRERRLRDVKSRVAAIAGRVAVTVQSQKAQPLVAVEVGAHLDTEKELRKTNIPAEKKERWANYYCFKVFSLAPKFHF